MFEPGSIAYEYDGTYEGFLCCVFACFEKKETPPDVRLCDTPQLLLEEACFIETDPVKAERVRRALPQKISREAELLVKRVFLTEIENKELYMLRFVQLGFSMGADVLRHLTDDTVAVMRKAERYLLNESHRYKQFIRFSSAGGVLSSVIKPVCRVLPVIAPHFADRYPEEQFLIYDETHGMALVHRPGEQAIVPVDSFVMEEADSVEQRYRDLWCDYYDTIAIEGRYNPKCRMNHMPKRYWDQMTEFCRSSSPGLRHTGTKGSG